MRQTLLLAGMATLLLCGCQGKPAARVNAPPHGQPVETHDMQGTYIYMTDAALLADMTICDMHFLPHRAMLNDLGEQRLSRLASLMEAYGGTINLSTDVASEDLIAERMDTIIDFLAQAGIDTYQEVVVCDLPGDEGMETRQALVIYQNEGMYRPDKKRNSSSGAGGDSGK